MRADRGESMKHSLKLSDSLGWVVSFIALITFSVSAAAVPVQLENATATFSQGPFGGCPCPPSEAIDGILAPPPNPNGWAIDRFPGDFTTSETAVWQTVPDVGQGLLTFTMYFNDPNPGHLLGRFRLSVTTDDRSTYADGLAVGGNVTANWTVLDPISVHGPAGMTFTELPDDSILAGGVVPGQGIYEVRAVNHLAGVTGIRLEALEDPSLPQDGPGFYPPNGNFVLSEIQLDAVHIPEPTTLALLALSFVGIGLARRRKLI
jgi:PEP-CTERM motif-containing protein